MNDSTPKTNYCAYDKRQFLSYRENFSSAATAGWCHGCVVFSKERGAMARKTDAWKQLDVPATADDVDDFEDVDDDIDGKRCLICFELESTARKKLFFIPCAHAACETCVQSLRREAVCKDVKGVLCPYCRQTIENYTSAKPARPAARKRADDFVPAHLKNTRFVLKADKGCPKGKPRIPAAYGWQGITSIGGLNDYSPPPNVTGADGPGLKPNRSEENLLDNFQGLPIKSSDNLLAMAETVSGSKQLHFNLRNLSGKRQKHLLKQLLESLLPHARRLATHHCGNYTMQRMLAFASQHRSEQVNGECGYTALVRSMCKDKAIPDISCHEKGTFVVQKMVACMLGLVELKLVIDSIDGKVAQMANNSNACFSLERIVEICIVSVSQPADRQTCAPAPEAARYLCKIALELCATRDFTFKASHLSNYATPSLLVECLRWSATESRTRALLLSLARKADDFAAMGKWGKRFLQGLLSLDIPEVAEAIVDSFVRDPERSRVGCFASLALESKELFYSCLAAPCLSDAYRDKIVRDFMLKAQEDPYFLKNQHILQGFCFGLSLLPPNIMNDHIELLKALGTCSPSLLQTVKGMQSEYCLPHTEETSLQTDSSESTNSSNGPAPLTASAQALNGTCPSSLPPRISPPPVSAVENFLPLAETRRASAPPETNRMNVTGNPSALDNGNTTQPTRHSENFPPLGLAVPTVATGQRTSKLNKLAKAAPANGHAARSSGNSLEGDGEGGSGHRAGAARRKLKMDAADSRSEAASDDKSAVLNTGSRQAQPGETALASSDSPRPFNDQFGPATTMPSSLGAIPLNPEGNGATMVQMAKLEGTHVPVPPPCPAPQGLALPLACAHCHVKPACMVLMHCRHLSSCKNCAAGLRFCPLCSAIVVELIEVTCAVGPKDGNTPFSSSSVQRHTLIAADEVLDSPMRPHHVLAPPVLEARQESWAAPPVVSEAPTFTRSLAGPPLQAVAPSAPQMFAPRPSPPAPTFMSSAGCEPSGFRTTFQLPASMESFAASAKGCLQESVSSFAPSELSRQDIQPASAFSGGLPGPGPSSFPASTSSASFFTLANTNALDSFASSNGNFQKGLGAYNLQTFQPLPRPPFLQSASASFPVSAPVPAASVSYHGAGSQQVPGNSIFQASPPSPGDPFPDVNLSFLAVQPGTDSASTRGQHYNLSINHYEGNHIQHDFISDEFSSTMGFREKSAVRPAPYLPPGLF